MMSYTEMKNTILFQYHKDIGFWYKLVGEFFEETDGFSKRYEKKCILDGQKVCIVWDDYSWWIND